MLRNLIFLFLGIVASPAFSQVVIAPFSQSQRLVNPGAAATRVFETTTAALEQNKENSTLLGLTQASVTEDLTINQLVSHTSWITNSKLRFEIDIAQQSGVKKNVNIVTDTIYSQSNTTENTVSLTPFQFIVGTQINPNLSAGLKTMFTNADILTDLNYRTISDNQVFTVSEENHLKARFLVLGIGFTYKIRPNIYASYGADFTEFNADRLASSQLSTATIGNSFSQTSSNADVSTSTTVRRDLLGLGVLFGNPTQEAFHSEISMERISPLAGKTDLKEGRLYRAMLEAQWKIFHFGVEYIQREGYMVESFNLIPYFLKFEEFSNNSKSDIGFFGGLKSSKGHGFGAFYTSSTVEIEEQLSVSDPNLYLTKKVTQSMGLSYSYRF